MAILEEKKATKSTKRKTIEQLRAMPDYRKMKQSNTKLQESLIRGLDALAADSGENKQDLVQLAIFDFLSHKGYYGKKPGSVKV